MAFELYKESYTGKVNEVTIGQGNKTVTVGGETAYPFYVFEGTIPNKPKIAMEVWDMEPDEWPDSALAPFKDVMSDPVAWAKKCVKEYGADLIVLQLKSTDPNGKNATPESAAATVKNVAQAIDVPLLVWGSANVQKDEAVLKKVAEETQGLGVTIGPVEDKNHKGIGAAAMGFGQSIISSSPIDVNLAKQVNILLENLGVPLKRVVIDPTTGGLGYGLEYSYSVMERLRMAALLQGDDKLQQPLINNVGNEVWKSKEAKQISSDAPTLGDSEKRGIMMESTAAVAYLMAGSDILIMRHPEAVKLVKSFIDLGLDGGCAKDVKSATKRLPEDKVDLLKLSPTPDLKIEEEVKKAAPAPKKEAPKAEPAKAEAKPAPAAAPAKPAAPAAPAAAPVAAPASNEACMRASIEAKIRAEMAAEENVAVETKAKAEADAKVKADADAKAKADADAKAKADAEAKKKADDDAKLAKIKADEDALREKVKKAQEGKPGLTMAKALTGLEKLINQTDWYHKRAA